MKKLYFVQPNSLLGNSIYYPYAVGVLAAYAFSHKSIRQNYELSGIIFKEDSDADFLNAIHSPSVIGFSNYFWNIEYNIEKARLIKEKYPECIIIFGGHQISRNSEYLEKYRFIDFLIFGEGEVPFYKILEALAHDSDFSEIPNIARRINGDIVINKEECVGVDEYPSPYQAGVFEKLLNVPRGLEFNAQLETNRGCPYHCSFCDWCEYDIPMRLFSLEKIKADLRWISEHKVAYCMCIDSNFGLFERDEEIAAYAVQMKNQNGYPDKFGASFAKNKTERIFRINKLFHENAMSKGVSLAFQSMSEKVLEYVSRKNMNKDELSRQLTLYHEAGIPTYTELILGLPGETTESFCRGICELLELGQHDTINVFRCEVYPNSVLARKDYMKTHAIKTAINKLNLNHCKIDNAVFAGGLEYITETATMSREELIDATVFSSIIQSVHCRGMLQCFAIYLREAKGISYYDFYKSFFNRFSSSDGVIARALSKIRQSMKYTVDGIVDFSYIDSSWGDITWPYDEAIFLDFICHFDEFYNEAKTFLSQYDIDPECFEDLLCYQKQLIVVPFSVKANTVKFKYNWKSYFDMIFENRSPELVKKETSVEFASESVFNTTEDYAKVVVWYGRRNKKTIRQTKVIE